MQRIWHSLALVAVMFVIAGWSMAPHAAVQTTDPTTCSDNDVASGTPYIRLQDVTTTPTPTPLLQATPSMPCDVALDPGATVAVVGENWNSGQKVAITITCADPQNHPCQSTPPNPDPASADINGHFQTPISVGTAFGIFTISAATFAKPAPTATPTDPGQLPDDASASISPQAMQAHIGTDQTASPVILVVEQTSPGNLTWPAVGLGVVAFTLSWFGRPRRRGRAV